MMQKGLLQPLLMHEVIKKACLVFPLNTHKWQRWKCSVQTISNKLTSD